MNTPNRAAERACEAIRHSTLPQGALSIDEVHAACLMADIMALALARGWEFWGDMMEAAIRVHAQDRKVAP